MSNVAARKSIKKGFPDDGLVEPITFSMYIYVYEKEKERGREFWAFRSASINYPVMLI